MSDQSSQRVQTLLKFKEASVVKISPDGDCFFEAVSRALSEISRVGNFRSAASVASLRNVVADTVEDEQLIMFWECASAGLEEYSFMKSVVSLEQLRDRLRESGREVGSQRCVWADAFAVQTVSSALNVMLYVIDDCGRTGCNFLTVKPEVNLKCPAASRIADGVGQISARSASKTEEDIPAVFLLRSRGKHYSLVSLQHNLFTYSSCVPASIRELFACPPEKSSFATAPPSALPLPPLQRRRRREREDAEEDDHRCLSGVGRKRKSGLKSLARPIGRGVEEWIDDLAWEGVGSGRRVGSWREPPSARRGEGQGEMTLLWHRDMLDHVTSAEGEVHQEGPDRVDAILRRLKRTDAPAMAISEQVGLAGRDRLCAAHSERYVEVLEGLQAEAERGERRLSPVVRRAFRGGGGGGGGGGGERGWGGARQKGAEAGAGERGGEGASEDGEEGGSMTRFSRGTYRAARRAAGAVCCGVDRAVVGGGAKSQARWRDAGGGGSVASSRMVMCLVRPPGHHAGYDGIDETAGGCGFCVVNNVVVGAAYALDVHREAVQRVAIIDVDVHHGNGTENIVKRLVGGEAGAEGRGGREGKLWFGSVHLLEKFDDADQDFFPGSGEASVGGSVVNLPLCPLWSPPSMLPHLPRGRLAWRRQVERLLEAATAFEPSLVMVSVGFDGAEGDEGSTQDGAVGLDLQQEDFEWCGQQIGDLAVTACNGRVVSVLEGGYGAWDGDREEYDRSDLAQNCVAYLRGLERAGMEGRQAEAASHDVTAAKAPN